MDCGLWTVQTPWGPLGVEIGIRGVRRVSWEFDPADPPLTGAWAEVFAAYLAGHPIPTDLPVDLTGVTPFRQRVLAVCREIPFGATTTYAALAACVGSPQAARAVGQAMATNPVPLIIPCHRVLGAHGRLTGFRGGLAWKRALLEHEERFQGSGFRFQGVGV